MVSTTQTLRLGYYDQETYRIPTTQGNDYERIRGQNRPDCEEASAFSYNDEFSPSTPEQRHAVGAKEVPATVLLCLAGKIDQWWYRRDEKGVVFLVNETSVEEARELLESLTFAQTKLMRFELLPLGPLAPRHVLLHDVVRNA